MSAEVISFLLSVKNVRKRVQCQIILQCAPLLKGLKTACMVNLEQEDCRELGAVLEGTDLEYKILMENKGRSLVFLYRQRALDGYLRKGEVKKFLGHYGYDVRDTGAALLRLADRVRCHTCQNSGFPHEIGVFLDYPVADVRGFIEQNGKGELMCGYWKVYHNPGRAQMIFLAYDKARVSAVNEYFAGRTIREIAKREKSK